MRPRDDCGQCEDATQAAQREAVRELHTPDGEATALRCQGCDFEGWEAEPPEWPCRTARLVYSDDEIADILAVYATWSAWVRAAAYRARLACGWTFADDMLVEITRGLRRAFGGRSFDGSSAERVLVAHATGDAMVLPPVRARYDDEDAR